MRRKEGKKDLRNHSLFHVEVAGFRGVVCFLLCSNQFRFFFFFSSLARPSYYGRFTVRMVEFVFLFSNSLLRARTTSYISSAFVSQVLDILLVGLGFFREAVGGMI